MPTTITTGELRQTITAIRRISKVQGDLSKYEGFLDDALRALDGGRDFAAYTKVANTALNVAKASNSHQVRNALASVAFHAYSFCVSHSVGGRADFRPSRSESEAISQVLGGPVTPGDALRLLQEFLSSPADVHPVSSQPEQIESEHDDNDANPPDVPTPIVSSATSQFFEEAASEPLVERLPTHLEEWRNLVEEPVSDQYVVAFEKRVRRLLNMGEEGRQFGDFAAIEQDLAGLRSQLEHLSIPERPTEIQKRAQTCRDLAPIEFRLADEALFEASRRAWLVSAFWNDVLTEQWPANEEHFVYDILGYLNVIQAEYRYAAHVEDVLVLLRVSHLICRIASSEELVPSNFYHKYGRTEAWVRYSMGTVLAISGPGRVPPSRLDHDPRFIDTRGNQVDRDEFGGVLLVRWRDPEEREAAAAILLELTGWKLSNAERLIRTALRGLAAEVEVWEHTVEQVVARASKVKVLRPNPWDVPGPGKLITADRHALAVLASDLIHRTFPSLDSTISLNGTTFRQRRVPTFLCSADFGPLGIFKVDSRERIAREAANFTRYAQRLHPRYRASRCDRSTAVISEPDDRIEFVGGILTSYVFTVREAPRSLNVWFQASTDAVVLELLRELFHDALRPWYQHARLGVLDIISEYDLFSRWGLERLNAGLKARTDLRWDAIDHRSLNWLERLVDWVTDGNSHSDTEIEEHAAALQLCESLRAVTHGDLHLDNVMVLGKEGAEYPCLIDFEATGESHILKDFGRFTGAILFRTHAWDPPEIEQLRRGVKNFTSSGGALGSEDMPSGRPGKALRAIILAWQAYAQHWRGTAHPSQLELIATLVCSFLPFARYPDTRLECAQLALSLSGDIVSAVWHGAGAELPSQRAITLAAAE